MPRPTLLGLSTPPHGFRLSTLAHEFETIDDAKREDRKRAQLLRRHAAATQSAWGNKARDLADCLDPDTNSKVPRTLSSARYKRRWRRRVIGHIGRLIARRKDGRVSNFTVMRRNWIYHFDTLDDADLEQLIEQFRNDLNRAKGFINRTRKKRGKPHFGSWDGWLWGEIHGEHEPETNSYPLHIHGVATGAMIDVLNHLRKQRAYKPWPADGDVPGSKRPIVVSKKPYYNMLSAAAYNAKLYWPSKRVGVVGSGKVKRERTHSRIKGSQHSQVLLFLDRWTLPQITILYGLSVRGGQLVESKSNSA